jgi:molybdopterin converting factor small subunit
VKILLFGSLRDEIPGEVTGDIPAAGCSIRALRAMLVAGDPSRAPLARPSIRACVEHEIVLEDHWVRPGQEIAFVSPLSGG